MAIPRPPVTTFIVRISRDSAGRIRAQIERVSSGLKLQVDGCEAIGPAIAQMLTTSGGVGSVRPKQEPQS